jgi:hypothetical protein
MGGWKPKVRLRMWWLGPGSSPTVSRAQGSGLVAWANGRACENGGVGKERGIGRETARIVVEKSQSGGTGVWEHVGP